MGGGDLNTKKSWHPNTMKNQERVWKAEQAAAEEKKRIVELQREREMEHDRAKLNEMAQRNFGNSSGGDNRLHWMYDKPNKQAQHEDYLLGKEIGKEESETSQQDTIPAVSRRVVGSSMLTSTDHTQVDLARKMREDPLLLVKERERAARAALLNNPLQRKKIAELLRKEQEQTESQSKKKSKKSKGTEIDKLLAAKLNALGGEKGINLANLLDSDSDSSSSSDHSRSKKKKKSKKKRKKKKKAGTDSSDDDRHNKSKNKKKTKNKEKADTDSSDDDRHNKSKNKKKTKNKEKTSKSKSKSSISRNMNDFDILSRKNAESMKITHDNFREDDGRNDRELRKRQSSDDERHTQLSKKNKNKYGTNEDDNRNYRESRKRRSTDDERDRQPRKKSKRNYGREDDSDNERENRHSSRDRKHSSYVDNRRTDSQDKRPRAISPKRPEKEIREKKKGLSEEERNARLAAMAAAGAEHEAERGRRVAQQRADDADADTASRPYRGMKNEARSLPDSLQSRIHSNRHYIQRDRTHMDKNFARR